MLNVADLSGQLIEYLSLNEEYQGQPLDPHLGLKEQGIDSFTLIEILLYLEGQYGFALSPRLLTPANTQSIHTLATCYSQHHMNANKDAKD